MSTPEGSKITRKLRRQPGLTVVEGRKHMKVYRDGKLISVYSKTMGEGRAYLNTTAQLRRAGISI